MVSHNNNTGPGPRFFSALILLLTALLCANLFAQEEPVKEIDASEYLIDPSKPDFPQHEKNFLESKQVVKMCVDPDWMPMERIHNGSHEGIAADFLNIIERRLGIPVKLVVTNSWTESLDFAKARKCDIFSLAMATPERLEYMLFTKPYLRLPLVVATLKDKPFIDDVTTITDRKLGVVKGYAFGELLRKKYPGMQIEDTASLNDGLSKVERGELYGMIDTLASVGFAIQQRYPELKIAGKFDDNWELGIGVRNDEPLLNDIFERIIETITAAESQEIINRWISVKYEKGTDYTLLVRLAGIVLIFLIFIFYRQNLLKQHKQNLEKIVLERTSELEAAIIKAEEANAEKSRFLANMSHELRTPMHAIMSFSNLGLKHVDDERIRNYLEKINTSGRRLTNLLNDLLDLSKLEAGKFKADLKKHDLAEIASVAIAELSSLVKDKSISLEVSTSASTIGYFDQKLITQVIINLLSNAIKYSPESSEIKINILNENNESGEFLVFEVSDQGMGIPDDELQEVFDKFVQSTKSRSDSGGTGLGLPISQEIIELHRGKIWAESPPSGEESGTKFIFQIPIIPIGQA